MQNKKRIIIIYSQMVCGGSTTSLISLLNMFDYNKYEIDLLLYNNEGDLQMRIPPQVNVLKHLKIGRKVVLKWINPIFWIEFLKARFYGKNRSKVIYAQYLAKYEAKCCRKIKKNYDTGISFLEFFPMEYLVRKVQANKKIAWVHLDVKKAGLLKRLGESTYEKLDKIVLVSNICKNIFNSHYPNTEQKTVYIPNLLSSKTIRDFASNNTNLELNGKIKMISVCRITFDSKGLDRAVYAFGLLREEGFLKNLIWYIIGDGPDREKLEALIIEKGLEKNIILLGKQLNPYAIEKDMDVFLLPSRFEGKPMAVTEAMMLGVVPFVCEYSSAKEQIENGVDGIIIDNNDDALYSALKDLLNGKYNLQEMKENLLKRDYSNDQEIEKIYQLIEE